MAAGHTGDPAGAAGDRPRTESPRPPGAAGCGRLAPGGRRLTSRGARAGPQGPPPLSAPSYRSSCGPRQLVSSGGSRSCGRVVTRGWVRGGVAATVASPHAASTRVPAAACARRAAPNRCVLRARLSFNAPGYFVLRIPAPRNRKFSRSAARGPRHLHEPTGRAEERAGVRRSCVCIFGYVKSARNSRSSGGNCEGPPLAFNEASSVDPLGTWPGSSQRPEAAGRGRGRA